MKFSKAGAIFAMVATLVTLIPPGQALARSRGNHIYNFEGTAVGQCTVNPNSSSNHVILTATYNLTVTANWGVSSVTWTIDGNTATPTPKSGDRTTGYFLVSPGTHAVTAVSQASWTVTTTSCVAQPPVQTCTPQVSTALSPPIAGQSGTESLGSPKTESWFGSSSSCASYTTSLFNANTDWGSPAVFCSRVGTSGLLRKHVVWATYYLTPPGLPGVYRVAGYSVICNGKVAVPTSIVYVPAGPTYESSTL